MQETFAAVEKILSYSIIDITIFIYSYSNVVREYIDRRWEFFILGEKLNIFLVLLSKGWHGNAHM